MRQHGFIHVAASRNNGHDIAQKTSLMLSIVMLDIRLILSVITDIRRRIDASALPPDLCRRLRRRSAHFERARRVSYRAIVGTHISK